MTMPTPPAGDTAGQPESDDARAALSLAEEAEADAEAALAEAHAKAARARAERLRRQAEATTADQPATGTEDAVAASTDDSDDATPTDSATPADDATPTGTAPDAPAVSPKPRRRLRIGGRRLAVGAAVVVLCALLGVTGFMTWQVRAADRAQAREAEAVAVARQGVVNIMSLDFTNAEGDIQRVLDSATGRFKEDFQAESDFLIKALEESKVVTEVTVDAVAVESLSDDAAVVLVAAKSNATNAQDNQLPPQQFRVAVTLARDSGALKMSQVDFL